MGWKQRPATGENSVSEIEQGETVWKAKRTGKDAKNAKRAEARAAC